MKFLPAALSESLMNCPPVNLSLICPQWTCRIYLFTLIALSFYINSLFNHVFNHCFGEKSLIFRKKEIFGLKTSVQTIAEWGGVLRDSFKLFGKILTSTVSHLIMGGGISVKNVPNSAERLPNKPSNPAKPAFLCYSSPFNIHT